MPGPDGNDAWPSVSVLADPSRTLTVADVRARLADFKPPVGAHANLGPRRDAVWLRLPLDVPQGADAHWIVSIDYASIDRIDLYQFSDGEPPRVLRLGRTLPLAQRPWPSSRHAAALTLEPGRQHELLLRVETTSSMVLPINVSTLPAFHAAEARAQLLQGLAAGAALALLLHSLMQWLALRDPMFLYYALALAANTTFFLAYNGIGPLYLWRDAEWPLQNAAPMAVLLALFGGFLFADRVLGVRVIWPRVSQAMRGSAAVAALCAAAFAVGLIDYRAAQMVATLLGPLPMALAVPVAFVRARGGDRGGLLRGALPFNAWTHHAYQLGLMIEMVMWMRVLGVRIDDLRDASRRVRIERDALRSLAHTDPLTGLPNRRGLNNALARLLPGCSAERAVAVYLLDLDGFKPVNDRLGHDAGDEVLQGVARRLEAALRASDVVARLGGDEFVVVAARLTGDAEARALGDKLLAAFRQPFVAAGQTVSVGLTIGYALAPHDTCDADSLLKRADAAMYAGKQAGRHCLRRGRASVGLEGG